MSKETETIREAKKKLLEDGDWMDEAKMKNLL